MYSVLNTLSEYFQNMYTFTYQKTVLKSSKAFNVSLKPPHVDLS